MYRSHSYSESQTRITDDVPEWLRGTPATRRLWRFNTRRTVEVTKYEILQRRLVNMLHAAECLCNARASSNLVVVDDYDFFCVVAIVRACVVYFYTSDARRE